MVLKKSFIDIPNPSHSFFIVTIPGFRLSPLRMLLAVGCGIGSYVQGDTKGGTTALITELAGATIMGIGYVNLLNKALDYNTSSNYGLDLGLVYAGVACMMAGRVYECIRPFTYANHYNERLNAALNGGPSIAVIPTSVNGQVGTAVVGSVSF